MFMGKRKKVNISAIEVLDFAAEGKCMTKVDGQAVFLNGTEVAPGDVVDIEVVFSKKKFAEGRVLRVVSKSAIRQEPFCAHFGVCGGCKWQHIPYTLQKDQKTRQVHDQLVRIGHLPITEIQPIVGSDKTTFYRNKLEFTFSASRWLTPEEVNSETEYNQNVLGFHVPRRFDKVFPIEHCHLQPDPSNAIRLFLRDYAHASEWPFYDHVAHEGFFRNVMIRTTTTQQVMVVIQFARPIQDQIDSTCQALLDAFPNITSLNYFVNSKRNDSYQDLEPICFHGKPYIEEVMEGLTFRIGVKSFYQTNPEQAFELYKITRDLAEIKSTDLVYDLYTGTGTIANFVAKKARKVIGVEYVPEAIEDAKINSEINQITNTLFFAGDMKKVLDTEFIERHGRPDVLITDPPRAGMDKEVIEVIRQAQPHRIVYVSCNAATQARDLALLMDEYHIDTVQPVDMFPHTHHVENVVRLTRK